MAEAHPTIVYLDDQHSILRLGGRVLTMQGFEVKATSDPEEALAAVEAGADLFICDLLMPEINGFEACETLRERGWKGPILVVSCKTPTAEDRKRLQAVGADFMNKPFGPRELIQRTRQTIAEGMWKHRT